ncbi:MAG: hypothetical protein ACK55I_32800, partial [bacterium]
HHTPGIGSAVLQELPDKTDHRSHVGGTTAFEILDIDTGKHIVREGAQFGGIRPAGVTVELVQQSGEVAVLAGGIAHCMHTLDSRSGSGASKSPW